MKILLLYPTREEYIFETVPYTHIEADSGYYPPIGLLYISAYIEKFSKHTVKVCDAYTDKMTHEDIEKLIISYKPDVLGIYFSTYYLSDSITVARMAKKISNDITVIAGGPHAVVYPSETIAVDAVDYVMSGDSEISFTQLLSYLEIKDFDAIESMANVLSKKSANDKQIIREREKERPNLT
jgi:radical SAM superfamily enzyme YgiQ (UPF0313 family)